MTVKVHSYRDDDGKTVVVVGQQDIDIELPAGGDLELRPGEKTGFVRARVRNRVLKPTVEYTLDERDVPRPISTSFQL